MDDWWLWHCLLGEDRPPMGALDSPLAIETVQIPTDGDLTHSEESAQFSNGGALFLLNEFRYLPLAFSFQQAAYLPPPKGFLTLCAQI